MNHKNENHLTQQELLAAAVDLQDLDSARRTHLEACPECRRSHDLFQDRLVGIGRQARELAPQPSRPFRLPEEQTQRSWLRIKPLSVIGAAAAMLVAVLIWQPQVGIDSDPSRVTPALLVQDLHQDLQLMQSVDALVENALPEPYQALVSVRSPVGTLDTTSGDDFMDWLVPDIGPDAADETLT
jgi:hypothetical protein